MILKELENTRQNVGFNATRGDILEETYECPCGKGKVFYENVDIIGHKRKSISCVCKECDEKYTFGRGTATEK